MADTRESLLSAASALLADLQMCCHAYRDFAVAHATHYRIMFAGVVPGFEPSDDSKAVAGATFEALVDRVQRGVDAGLLGGKPTEIAASLWAASHGVISLEQFSHKPDMLTGDDPFDRTMAAITRDFRP